MELYASAAQNLWMARLDSVVVDSMLCIRLTIISETSQQVIISVRRQVIFSPNWNASELFRFEKMEVNYFQILLIDVTFYL